jgi:hypothetical protein
MAYSTSCALKTVAAFRSETELYSSITQKKLFFSLAWTVISIHLSRSVFQAETLVLTWFTWKIAALATIMSVEWHDDDGQLVTNFKGCAREHIRWECSKIGCWGRFGPNGDDWKGSWTEGRLQELFDVCSSPNIRVITWDGPGMWHVGWEDRCIQGFGGKIWEKEITWKA